MGTMDIRKQRLIKQCQVILGEDFDKDFIYADVDFSNARAIFKAYKLYESKEEGTDELVSQFKKDTPGELEELKEPFVVFNKKTKEVLATGSNSRSLFARRSGYARDNGLTVKDLEFKKVSKKQTVGTTLKEAVNFSDVEKVMKWAKKNIKAKKFEISKKNKIAFIEISSDNIFMLHTMRRGELYVVHDTRGISGKRGTAKEYEFYKDNAAEEVIKLISKILGIKENVIAAKNELEEKKIAGLVKKAEKSGISYGILKQVYNRGMAAWKTGHRPGTTPQQWAFARVNSFLTGGKTRTTADADLWAKTRK